MTHPDPATRVHLVERLEEHREQILAEGQLAERRSRNLRNEVLAIKQLPDSFVIDYGTSVRRLTPGGRSVVSVPGGVGDQSTGWKGKEYVVQIRSQVGPDVTEQYSLSQKSGKQLIVKVRLSGWSFPNVELTRVYDPAGAAEPRSFPSID